MKYSGYLDYVTILRWGFTNKIPQLLLFDWLYTVPSWADSFTTNEGEVYYFASRSKAIEEVPILTEKEDTIYRWYKDLEEMGLITLKKVDGKDYIRLTEKSKDWGRDNKRKKGSDGNPKLGQPSEKLGQPSEKVASTHIVGKVNKEKSAPPSFDPDFEAGTVRPLFRQEVGEWARQIPALLLQKSWPFSEEQTQGAMHEFLNWQDEGGRLKDRTRADLIAHFFLWVKSQKSFISDHNRIAEPALLFRQTVNWNNIDSHGRN